MVTAQDISLYTLIATVAVAIATIVYVVLTYGIMKASQQATLEQLRPYIVVQIESEDGWIDLRMRNIGARPAKDVEIVFDPPLTVLTDLVPEDDKSDFVPMLRQEFFAPQHSLKTALFETKWLVNNQTCVTRFTITITYRSLQKSQFRWQKDEFRESYCVDLSSYIYARKEAMFTDIHHFIVFSNTMSEKMKSMGSSLEKLASLAERSLKE